MFPARNSSSNLALVLLATAGAAPFVNAVAADQSSYIQSQLPAPAAVAARDAVVAIPVAAVPKGGRGEHPLRRHLQRRRRTYNNHNRNTDIDIDTDNVIQVSSTTPTTFPRVAGDDSNRVNIGINDPPPTDPESGEAEQAAVDGAIATIMAALPATTSAPTGTILSPTATATAAGSIMESDNQTECRLLGSFAILVQLALGGLALMSLVYKRWRERPQRPVKIWFFDVSKQVFGSVLVHGANVFMSLLTSGKFSIQTTPEVVIHQERMVRRGLEIVGGVGLGMLARRAEADEPYVPNPCSFYLLNLAIDTTLGIPILILIVRVTTKLVAHTPLGKPVESIQSGNYGNPPNAWWWLKQSIIYFCGLMGMKFVVLIIFMVFPWISRVGDWALGWTEGNEKLQIVFVMMLFPLIMNAMQYYIIDSYIKKQIDGGSEDGGSDSGSDTERGSVGSGTAVAGGHGGVSYGVISASDSSSEASDDDDDDEDDKEERKKRGHGQRVRLTRRDSSKDREYDPTIDGDEGTVVGSSSSMASEVRRGLLGKELIRS